MTTIGTTNITATITGEHGQPLTLELRHDSDGAYRWYQDGEDTETSGTSIPDAVAAGRAAWRTWAFRLSLWFLGDGTEVVGVYPTEELAEAARKSPSNSECFPPYRVFLGGVDDDHPFELTAAIEAGLYPRK